MQRVAGVVLLSEGWPRIWWVRQSQAVKLLHFYSQLWYPKHVCKQVNEFWSMPPCRSVQVKAGGLSQWQSWRVCGCDWCYHFTVTRVNLTSPFPVWGEIFLLCCFFINTIQTSMEKLNLPFARRNPLWIHTPLPHMVRQLRPNVCFSVAPKRGSCCPTAERGGTVQTMLLAAIRSAGTDWALLPFEIRLTVTVKWDTFLMLLMSLKLRGLCSLLRFMCWALSLP